MRPSVKLAYITERTADYGVSSQFERVPVDGFLEDDLRFSAGLKASYSMSLSSGWTFSPEVGGSLGISSSRGSDATVADPFGTLEAGFTIAGVDEWSVQAVGTAELETRGTKALGGRIGLIVPF